MKANVMAIINRHFQKHEPEIKKMKRETQPQNSLANCPQLSLLIYLLLSVAQSGGMSESRAEEFYDEIHENFSNIQGEEFWAIRDELLHVLMMSDEDFDRLDGESGFPFGWKMN
jgi:hypothetical protein